MPFFDFVWTEHNEEHIAEHGVTPHEASEVVCAPEFETIDPRNGRSVAFGETSNGKYLKVVYELLDDLTVYVITAYEVEP